MHGMTKFQFYIKRYGSAINFYGGTGESSHKYFVKAPGLKTQRRVSEFASQVAIQYYNMLVTTKALPLVDTYEDSTMRSCRLDSNIDNYQCVDANLEHEDVSFQLSGQFSSLASDILTNAEIQLTKIYPKWKTNKNGLKDNNYKFQLHPRLMKAIKKEFNERNIQDGFESLKIEGFTRLTTISKKTAE